MKKYAKNINIGDCIYLWRYTTDSWEVLDKNIDGDHVHFVLRCCDTILNKTLHSRHILEYYEIEPWMN